MYFGAQSSIRKSKARLLVALCLLHSFPHRPVLKMLSRNLVIASVAVVFLASTVSTAPVEDKEPEENDFEAEEGEEELSEEEEDDDDSKSQHMKGAGSQQATAAPKGLGMTPGSGVAGESPNGQKLNGGTQTGQVSSSSTSTASDGANGNNGRDGYSRPSGSSSHGASYDGQDGSKSEIVPSGVGAGGAGANGGSGSKVPGTDGGVHSVSISVVSSGQAPSGHIAADHGSTMSSSHTFGHPSAGQTSGDVAVVSSEVQSQPAGSEGFATQYENGEMAHEGSQIESPEIPEIESNGNGHKQLLNGGETGFTGLDHFTADTSQIQGTGGFDSFGTSPHLEITGIIDQSSHDFLVGLMGGIGESFGPDTQTDGLGTLLDLLDTPPDVPPTCLVTDAVSTDHMGLAFQVDSAAAGLSPGHPSSGGPVLDAPPDSLGPDYVSADNGNGDYTHSISTSDNGAQSKSPADTTDSSLVFDTMSHPGHSFIDYSEGGADNGADSPDTNGNGNGRHKPVVDIQKGGTGHQDAATEMHHTAGDPHAVSSHPDAVGALDLVDHTLSPYADTTGRDGVTGVTDMAGVAGDPVTEGQVQTDMTGNHVSSAHRDTCQSITLGRVSCVVCVSEKQILFMRLGLDSQMPQRHIVAWFRQTYQSQGIHSQGFPHRQTPWAQANLVLRNRHSQLYQQVNSTTHLVRVLKVQKMWNWKIPADFHMKPRVRFLRYRFQCTDQYAWQRNREPAR
ncbi:hornerin isoform X4 [Megalobrama amblycephala]|uniref:hornerin isoform X4 n=1 Tax=Megalobrama amblycephala TaxID=75352 RepID=UPI002013E74B|nr:hornerin isoform X4 [Megalobrama amblycephala]